MLNELDTKVDSIGVQSIELLDGFNVHLTFTDSTQRDVNLEPYLRGPIFEPIRANLKLFRQVFIDPEWQCLAWSNGADIDPDALYYDGPPPWAETNIDGSPLNNTSSPK